MTIFVIIENWDVSLPSIFFFLSTLSFLFLHPLFPSFEVLMNFSVFPFFLSQIGNSRCHFRSFETFILRYTLFLYTFVYIFRGFPGGSEGKEAACNARDQGLIPGLGGTPGEGNGSPLQYSCLENSKDRGTWRAKAHEVAKSWTQVSG